MHRHRCHVPAVDNTIAVDVPWAIIGIVAQSQVVNDLKDIVVVNDAIPVDIPRASLGLCDEHLARIPGIVSYYSGKHFDVGRETVDSEYDVALYLGFMSKDDYEDYLEHPTHIRMESKWRPRLQWMRVHDTIDRTR